MWNLTKFFLSSPNPAISMGNLNTQAYWNSGFCFLKCLWMSSHSTTFSSTPPETPTTHQMVYPLTIISSASASFLKSPSLWSTIWASSEVSLHIPLLSFLSNGHGFDNMLSIALLQNALTCLAQLPCVFPLPPNPSLRWCLLYLCLSTAVHLATGESYTQADSWVPTANAFSARLGNLTTFLLPNHSHHSLTLLND